MNRVNSGSPILSGVFNKYGLFWPGLLLTGLLLAFGLLVNSWLSSQYLAQQLATQNERMEIYRNALSAAVERYQYLPAVLSQNDQLFALAFSQPDKASESLVGIQADTGADAIYILRTDGMTIAASNHDQPVSFVGNNYGYRPYFTQALTPDLGRGYFYGIGATTNIPGYFVSTRYPRSGEPQAVIVVKVNLGTIEESWRSGAESVFVSDENGVIILSSRDEWRYKTLQPLTPHQKATIDSQKQFASEPLTSLNIPVAGAGEAQVRIADTRYIHTTDGPTDNGWKIHYLTPYAAVISQIYAFWCGVNGCRVL